MYGALWFQKKLGAYKDEQSKVKLHNMYTKSEKVQKAVLLSGTSSALLSVEKPSEGNLGLVREKRGGKEVGTIAYPDLHQEGGKVNQSSYFYLKPVIINQQFHES